MTVGEWIAAGSLVLALVGGWTTLLLRLGARLKSIEDNHLKTLDSKIEALPCQEHMEALVAMTIRLEVAVERIEKAERRLNGG